ncbi:MAG TPA: alkaline phosphatase family protein [Nitrososphaerales archaeon]|nr:alkaline phosphatase family protein [Nitrososphaerales archaeon]
MDNHTKVAIIGLDSVPPELMFQKLLEKLPNIKKMYDNGLHGNLETCHPPITVPAWMVMMTGKNPGKLGIYGFRHRKGFSYKDGYIVNSTTVKEKTVWEILSEHGKKSIVLGVPPGYPPKQIPNCNIVSCFITPGMDKAFTYPAELKDEILNVAKGKYIFDVTFRTENREAIKKELFEMTEKRFDVAEYLAKTKPWDFFIMHEIGFDRLHHAFWKFFDPTHPKYTKGNQYENLDLEYYSMVDKRIGRLVELFGEECTTFVLSDHGSKSMSGAFCVNQWLENEGYLAYKIQPKTIVDFDKAEIDWQKTKAWGWGGYYARIFFNVKGREPSGIVDPKNLEAEKKMLMDKVMTIPDDKGTQLKNMVLFPEQIYGVATGDKPDLMVYFGDLDWRSAGTIGHDSLYLFENDTGPDDSVHSMNGIFMMYNPKKEIKGRQLMGAKIADMAPTLLQMFGITIEKDGFDGRRLEEIVDLARK